MLESTTRRLLEPSEDAPVTQLARPRLRPPSSVLRRWLRTLHLWLGLSIGVVFAALGVSGTVLVLQPELLRWQHPQLFDAPAPTEAQIAQGLARLLSAPPPGVTGGDLPRAEAPFWQLFAGDQRLYFDAEAQQLLLERGVDDDWVLWLRDLHTHLLAGHDGEQLLGVVGLVCLFLLISGLYLWWPRIGRTIDQLRWYRGPPVKRWLSWHRSAGTLVLPLLLLMTLTGTAMVYPGAARKALALVLADAADPTPPAAIAFDGDAFAGSAALLASARSGLPGATLSRFLLPATDDARLTFRVRAAGEWHPFGRSLAHIDRRNAALVATADATALAPAARANHAIYPLHSGAVGGWPYRLTVAAAGLLPLFLLVTGTLLWWRRR